MTIESEARERLERRLSYKFTDDQLFERAFIHPSADHVDKTDYQRLEFLGDQVIGFAVSVMLFRRFPEADEGLLSKVRSNLIDVKGLSLFSIALDLGEMLILGRGEERHGGRKKLTILSDVFESLMAVIYLEAGWREVSRILEDLYRPVLSRYSSVGEMLASINRDYKTGLQELCQDRNEELPVYHCVSMEGPEHNLEFTIKCTALGMKSSGTGKSKKEAEQEAAEKLIALLKERDSAHR